MIVVIVTAVIVVIVIMVRVIAVIVRVSAVLVVIVVQARRGPHGVSLTTAPGDHHGGAEGRPDGRVSPRLQVIHAR